ncbi:MAG: hypothetical protein ABSE98_12225 [Acidimicrobiales bacterium]|jgi:hypothetical protein
MEHTKSNVTFEREADDAILSLGHSGSGPISIRTDDPVLELHYEVTIEHWVRDDRSRRNRFRWFVWDRLGIGDPPLRAETATADEVTTVTGAESVPVVQNLPYRRLVKVVRRDAPESDHSKNPPRSA